jgi:hypothetical protein
MSKPLSDTVYDQEIERMSDLPGFPHLPAAQREFRRVLRRVTETDKTFLHNLITDVVDSVTICPTPAELIQRAGAMRHRAHPTAGDAGCELCHGSGFVTTVRQVAIAGIAPYEAEFAAVCTCRGGK